MKLGLHLGYWGAQPPAGAPELVRAAEDSGFDAVFTAEAWGSDAFTPLAWWGRETTRLRLGTSIAQMSGRTPASLAMHTLTLDHLSQGRVILGLGVSGPQVVEGWYGQPFGKPLERTREVVDIVRKVLRRTEPLTSDGPHHPLPFNGPGTVGLGKPLKSIVHPFREDVPIWLAAEGPKNVALTAEIADGWLPLFYSPACASMYDEWLDEGFARPGARRARDTFEIAASCAVVITDDAPAAVAALKPSVALYMGGMGAKEQNFHKNVFVRMGYGDVADQVQDLFLQGKRAEAGELVPDRLVHELHLIGDAASVHAKAKEWEAAGVTTLLVSCATPEDVQRVADAILG
jgi:F420-dependent oxidoreductase-like protein